MSRFAGVGAAPAWRAATALAVVLAIPALAQEQSAVAPAQIKLSTALGPAYAQGEAGRVWAALISERSAGRIATKHYPGAVLAQRDADAEFAALRDGAIDLAVGSTLVWATPVPGLNVFGLPWLIADEAALESLLDGEVGERLSAVVDAAGVVPMAWSANGFTVLATKAPVHKPADVAGRSIRVQASPLLIDTLAALGAASSAMGLADAHAAWASGTLDGQEASLASYAASRLDAAGLTHVLLWGAHADVLVFAVNRARWDAWSEADRRLVRQAAQDAAREARVVAQRSTDAAAMAGLARQGVTVTRLTSAGKGAFRAATRPVYERWGALVGTDLLRAAEAAIGGPPTPMPK